MAPREGRPHIDIYPYHCLMVYNMIYIIVILS